LIWKSLLIWKILHERVRYEERGPSVSVKAKKSADSQDDPGTPEPRLPRRSGLTRSISVSDFRPWLIREAA
jgi:hypothetical protein